MNSSLVITSFSQKGFWYILVCNEDCAQTIEEGIEIILLTQFMHMA